MDFGIAKQSGSAAERGLTQAGVFVGTVDYAAPEQIEAKEITAAADIYAFGGVLYEALTGKKPYERDTDVAVMFAHITEPPPEVTEVAARAARGARRGDRAAMAKAPDERYATCREMIEAARAALGGKSAAPSAPRRRWSRSRRRRRRPSTSNLPRPRDAARRPRRRAGRGRRAAAAARRAARHADRPRRHRQVAARARGRDDVQDDFAETYFVDLSPVQGPDLVGSAIADVLGVREAPEPAAVGRRSPSGSPTSRR